MFPDVSLPAHSFQGMLLIMYRPTYFRGIDVWHLSAPEEDETYQDHTHVVPALNSWENVFSFHAQIIARCTYKHQPSCSTRVSLDVLYKY